MKKAHPGNPIERAVAAAILAFILAVPRGASGDALRISGSGAAVESIRVVAESFVKSHRSVKIGILSNMGSGGAVKAVLDGALDIAVTSRRLTDDERGRGAHERAYARTPFVFAVHPNAAGRGVTRREVIGIYRGTTSVWRDGTPIRLVLRLRSDSDAETLVDMWPEMAEALSAAYGREGMVTALTDQEAADIMESSSGAFGTTTLSLVATGKRKVRVLALDGIRPGLASLADGSYPYAKTFYLVTGPAPSAAARAFVGFVRSPAGAAILKKSGCAAMP